MKAALPILFLIIFLGCKSSGGKNTNQQAVYQHGSESNLYLIDSTLLKFPCEKESLMPIMYRGDIRYTVKDIHAAEKEIEEIIVTTYALDLHTRNESFSNGIQHKSYQYNLPTKDFLIVERKLDSLLGKAESKFIQKTELNYERIIGNLIEEQKNYKMHVAQYNNGRTSFQEKNELLTIISNNANTIKTTQSSIGITCKNTSALTIQLSAK